MPHDSGWIGFTARFELSSKDLTLLSAMLSVQFFNYRCCSSFSQICIKSKMCFILEACYSKHNILLTMSLLDCHYKCLFGFTASWAQSVKRFHMLELTPNFEWLFLSTLYNLVSTMGTNQQGRRISRPWNVASIIDTILIAYVRSVKFKQK